MDHFRELNDQMQRLQYCSDDPPVEFTHTPSKGTTWITLSTMNIVAAFNIGILLQLFPTIKIQLS